MHISFSSETLLFISYITHAITLPSIHALMIRVTKRECNTVIQQGIAYIPESDPLSSFHAPSQERHKALFEILNNPRFYHFSRCFLIV